MPWFVRRPRALAVLAVAAALTTLGVMALHTSRLAPVSAHAAGRVGGIPDVQRDPWFDMRLLATRPEFGPVSVSAGPAAPVSALGGILVDLDTGAVLWQHDPHRRLPPASTAKIMTALVALENFSPARLVTVTADALHQGWDETRMGLAAGQRLTVAELLDGMLMVSGNDAATALAADTVGLPRFIAAMNAQAQTLGMRDTHFANPVGLSGPEEYSTAYDLAVVSAAAMRSPLFASIVAARSAILPAGTGHPAYDLQSINLLLSMYPAAVGIKPGWTGDAGYCLVGMAIRSGHRLISVLLNAPYVYSQSRRLLDWGFTQEGLTSTLPTPTPSPAPSPHG